MNPIKFNKHHVTNGEIKARVFYSLDNRADKKPCVTIYDKDYGHKLNKLFGDAYENDSDIQTDYIEAGRVRLFEDHPLYAIARAAVEKMLNERTK
jgi:hypothetical protein